MLDGVRRLLMLIGRDRFRRELDEEIQAHCEELGEALEAEGHAPAEAARLARLRLGGLLQTREAAGDVWQIRPFETWSRDARIAWRGLRRTPAFLAAAAVTLALGIGATTAIYSAVYGVAFRPLPYPNPERLVRLYEANPANARPRHEVAVGTFSEWRTGARTIASMALVGKAATWYPAMADPPALRHATVSPAFFDVLGAKPVAGRLFRPEREYSGADQDEVVLSFAAWQRLFGGARSAVGSTLSFNGVAGVRSYRVVGVMPRGFAFLEPIDVWTPQIVDEPIGRLLRLWRYDSVVARLAPGTTVDQAGAELRAISARLTAQYPETNAGWSCEVVPLRADVIGRFASASWMLLGAVACVLLVACANVASLLAARAAARERETAVRLALGASRWSLVRLWVAEGCLLTAVGATLGTVVAWWGVAVLKHIAPPSLPRVEDITLGRASLVAALASAAVALLAFTLASLAGLRGRTRAASGGAWPGTGQARPRARLRDLLLGLQSALAVVLVVLATLLTLSFLRLGRVDLGWQPDGVLTLHVAPSIPGQRPWYNYILWADSLVRRLEATPGIERAAITTQIPLGQDSYPATLARGRTGAQDELRWPIVEHHVTDGYFQTLSIGLRDGRLFDRRDAFGEAQANWSTARPERGAAVVTESVARALWPGERAVGKIIRLPDIDNVMSREVVGVVGDLQFFSVGEPPALHVFVPWSEMPTGSPRLIVRGTGRAQDIIPAVRAAVRAERSGTGVDRVIPLDDLVDRATSQARFSSEMVTAFGILALVLAAVGTYGMSVYLVAARRRDIGLRIALGAAPSVVIRQVLARSLRPVSLGGLAGLVAAAGASRAMRALSFEIGALGAQPYAVAALSVVVAAAAAALIPAVRASRLDPAATLRTD